MGNSRDTENPNHWQDFFNSLSHSDIGESYRCANIDLAIKIFGAVVSWDDSDGNWKVLTGEPVSGTTYYYYPLGQNTFAKWHFWIKSLGDESGGAKYIGLCKRGNLDIKRPIGYLVDNEHRNYTVLSSPLSDSDEKGLDIYFVQNITANEKGLGKNANIIGVSTNGEYRLKTIAEAGSDGHDE